MAACELYENSEERSETEKWKMSAITINNANWGATSLSAIRGVLESAYRVLTEAFMKAPVQAIRVSRWGNDHPLLVKEERPYLIYLATSDRYWCQYSYQFAHELCHILTNADSFRNHKHKWLEEALCDLASLFVLDRLADSWTTNPPPTVANAAEFAPHHRTYAERIEQQHSLPPHQCLADWLRGQLDHLEADAENREWNAIVAVALLAEFRRDTTLWVDCGVLNTWDASNDRNLAEYLDSWSARLLEQGRTPRTPPVLRRRFGLDAMASQ